MKKLLALILLFAFTLGISGCGTGGESEQMQKSEDVVGIWELESVKLNGITYVDADFLGDYDYAFTLNADGTAEARVLGVTYSTTYTMTGDWITFADAALTSVKLEVSGDTLLMKLSLTGAGLVFTRK